MLEAGLLQISAQIMSNSPCPQKRAPRIHFWGRTGRRSPHACLALLFTKAVDVDSNPGQTTHTTVIWTCYKTATHTGFIRNSHRTTHNDTPIQLHQNEFTTELTDLWIPPVDAWSMLNKGEPHQSDCLETDVKPL